MNFAHFKAGKDDDGRRLDRIIRRFLGGEPISSIYKSLRKGLVKLNGKKCGGNEKVFEGDDIQIADFLVSKNTGKTTPNSLKEQKQKRNAEPLPNSMIILRNEDFLVLNKPYDIAVQGGNGKISLSDMVKSDWEFHHQKKDSLSFSPGPLHRLDRKTSGILVFSQSLKGAKYFSDLIKNHTAKKIYLALCQGNLKAKQSWKDEISREENEKRGKKTEFQTVKVGEKNEKSKSAVTHAFPLAHGIFADDKKHEKTEVTLVRFEIETGRTHQIRAQSANHGFPLLGDTAYGGKKIEAKKYGRDFFLHAAELILPESKIECEISENFKKILSDSLINAAESIIINSYGFQS